MPSYEYLDHTADMSIVGHGADMEEALTSLAFGMFNSMIDIESIIPRDKIEVTVDAVDPESLVVDWLNELLFHYEVDGFIPKKLDLAVSDTGTHLEAKCIGETSDPNQRQILTVVKAATYHNLKLTHNDGWHIEVTLDI